MQNLIDRANRNRRLLLTVVMVVVPGLIIFSAIIRVWTSESVEQYVGQEVVQSVTANWSESGHADYTSRSFTYWDDDDPALIPSYCAACHSTLGLLDRVGERDSSAGSVSEDMPTGTVVSCVACHNNSVHQMQTVAFPSGDEVDVMDSEAGCLLCHQGLESTVSVNDTLAGLDDDRVDDDLEFINVHYHIAGATLMGTTARGGYQYAGLTYDGRFEHTEDFQSCHSCHDPHHLRVDPLACSACHVNVTEADDLRLIRYDTTDYDGDGDIQTGIAEEIDVFHTRLLDALQSYAVEVADTPIVYDSSRHPYFFDDGEGEDRSPYSAWTPRLLRAAYNYHFVVKDPGAYAHNPRYVMQLLYDSLHDLSEQAAVDMDGLSRP